jgi:hypothetical protein
MDKKSVPTDGKVQPMFSLSKYLTIQLIGQLLNAALR